MAPSNKVVPKKLTNAKRGDQNGRRVSTYTIAEVNTPRRPAIAAAHVSVVCHAARKGNRGERISIAVTASRVLKAMISRLNQLVRQPRNVRHALSGCPR